MTFHDIHQSPLVTYDKRSIMVVIKLKGIVPFSRLKNYSFFYCVSTEHMNDF